MSESVRPTLQRSYQEYFVLWVLMHILGGRRIVSPLTPLCFTFMIIIISPLWSSSSFFSWSSLCSPLCFAFIIIMFQRYDHRYVCFYNHHVPTFMQFILYFDKLTLCSPYLCRIWKLGNIPKFQTVCKIFQTDIKWTAIKWHSSFGNRSKSSLRNKFSLNGFLKDSQNFQENTWLFFSKAVGLQRAAFLGRDFMLKICWRQHFLLPEWRFLRNIHL